MHTVHNITSPTYSVANNNNGIKPKVLLVDDDRTLRRIVRAKIGDHCTLLMAGNLSLGSALYKSEKPDLALIDIGLPDGSGYDLLKKLLNMDPSAYAVMFSGYSDNDHIHKSIVSGAKGYISKPFDTDRIMSFVHKCME